jgi:predicted amidohydrolase
MRIALIQTRTPANQAAALDALVPQIRAAAGSGAKLILTPEGSNLLERNRERLQERLALEEDDVVACGLRELARDLRVEILIGSVLVRRGDGSFANRCLMIGDDGGVVARYDKIHMFDVNLPTGEEIRESRTYRPGAAAVLAPSAAGLLGLTICYDLRFPQLYRSLAMAGAEILTVPAAFTKPTGEAHWEVLLRARAIETGAFVLAPAQGGLHEDGRRTFGRTLAVSPWGVVIGRLDHDDEGVLMVDIDRLEVAKARSAIPSLVNGQAFEAPKAPEATKGPEAAKVPEASDAPRSQKAAPAPQAAE